MKTLFLSLGLFLVFGVTYSFAADSDLVKLAKQEKERRAKTEAKKTLTNQDIEEIRKKQLGIESSGPEGQPVEGEKTAGGEKKKEEDPAAQETYWRGRKDAADAGIQDAQARVNQLQSEINSLTTSFYAEADGVGQRPLIESERASRIDELKAAQQALEDAKAGREDLDDEARKAGALPGWLRD